MNALNTHTIFGNELSLLDASALSQTIGAIERLLTPLLAKRDHLTVKITVHVTIRITFYFLDAAKTCSRTIMTCNEVTR